MPHVARHLVLASLVALVAAGFVMPVAASAATVSVRITDHLSPAELPSPPADDPLRERRQRAAPDTLAVRACRIRSISRAGPVVFDEADGEAARTLPRRAQRRGHAVSRPDRGRGGAWGRRPSRRRGGGSSGGGSTSSTSSSESVSMAGRAFSPATVTIAAGARSRSATTTTAGTRSGRGRRVQQRDDPQGGSWKRTFKQAGTFSYLCAIHPEMTGKVVVKGTSAAATPKPKPSPTPKPASKRNGTGVDAEIRDFASPRRASAFRWAHRHVADAGGRRPSHRDRRGRLVRLGDDRGRRLVGSARSKRPARRLRLRVPPADGGVVEVTAAAAAAAPPAAALPSVSGTPDPSPSSSPSTLPTLSQSALPAGAAVAPAATQPPLRPKPRRRRLPS